MIFRFYEFVSGGFVDMPLPVLRRFISSGSGAVSTDWVVLTSLAVVTGVATIYYILGEDGGVSGIVHSMTGEVDKVSQSLQGVANEAGSTPE